MKPFQKSRWAMTPEKFEACVKATMKCYPDKGREVAEQIVKDTFTEDVYINDQYQVSVRHFSVKEFGGDWVHLSIKRLDREPIHDWRDLQEIKNLIVGRENEAIELYPAESRKVDSANQFHLWVLKTKGVRFPIGYQERLVLDHNFDDGLTEAKQRPFKDTILDQIINDQVRDIVKKGK